MNVPAELTQESPSTLCHLCEQARHLRGSHIIPNWVYRDEIRDAKGKMVNLNLNRVTSKAIELPLLCHECEQKFSVFENEAKKFGSTLIAGKYYKKWLFDFATSISWRVVKCHQLCEGRRTNPTISAILSMHSVGEAMEVWQTYLRRGLFCPSASRHRQHLFMVHPDYEARSAIVLTLGQAGPHTFVLSRFSSYSILGILHSAAPNALASSEIKVGGGRVPDVLRAPPDILRYVANVEDTVMNAAVGYSTGATRPTSRSRGVTLQPTVRGSE